MRARAAPALEALLGRIARGGPSTVVRTESGVPLPLKLSRIGGFPGTGTHASVDLDLPGALSVPLGTQSYPFSGCEVPIPVIGGCALNVQSLDFSFTKADISNLQIHSG